MKSWFVSLCLVTALLQAVYAAVRVMISYRALELGGDGATVGILTALYSLVPLVAAIPIGRASRRKPQRVSLTVCRGSRRERSGRVAGQRINRNRVFFASNRMGTFDVYSRAADGATVARVEYAGSGF